MKGWGLKSSVCPSKPGKSNFFGGTSRDFAGISRRWPKSLRKESLCSIFGPYLSSRQFPDPRIFQDFMSRPFPLSRPLKRTYKEHSRKGPRRIRTFPRKKWEASLVLRTGRPHTEVQNPQTPKSARESARGGAGQKRSARGSARKSACPWCLFQEQGGQALFRALPRAPRFWPAPPTSTQTSVGCRPARNPCGAAPPRSPETPKN